MRLKYLTAFIVTVTILILSGCTQTQITSKADELMANKWFASDKFGKEVALSFAQDTAELKVKTNDFSCEIIGTALVDEQTIRIFDNTLKQAYNFDYSLYGDRIEIIYNENTVELNKVTD